MAYIGCDTVVKPRNAAAFTKPLTEVLAWTCTACISMQGLGTNGIWSRKSLRYLPQSVLFHVDAELKLQLVTPRMSSSGFFPRRVSQERAVHPFLSAGVEVFMLV